MKARAILLQVKNQFISNWFKTLLASGGIMIGVWAMSLTTSISLSVADTIVTAINSQNGARTLSLRQAESGETNLFSIGPDEKYLTKTTNQIEEELTDIDNIEYLFPATSMSVFRHNTNEPIDCTQKSQELEVRLTEATSPTQIRAINEDFISSCPTLNVSFTPLSFESLNDSENWYGDTNDLKPGRVAVCFECDEDDPLYELFDAENPEDLVGRTITLETHIPADVYAEGTLYDPITPDPSPEYETQNLFELTIDAVFDDREVRGGFFGSNNNRMYANLNFLEQTYQIIEPEFSLASAAYLDFTLVMDSFEDVEGAVEEINDQDIVASSGALFLINAIDTAFIGVSVILGLFGFIALIASMFGIVNVMTITVLKRKKEIGILKALGSRGLDIFNIFILESSLLGFMGWLGGTILTLLSLGTVSVVFNEYVLGNDEWKANLENFNITEFEPQLYWQISLITLVLALLFTIISGLAPSLRASRQNPVDVIR